MNIVTADRTARHIREFTERIREGIERDGETLPARAENALTNLTEWADKLELFQLKEQRRVIEEQLAAIEEVITEAETTTPEEEPAPEPEPEAPVEEEPEAPVEEAPTEEEPEPQPF